ncbi:hypothetical protein GCM10027277_52570 [Pseudoduganella ginsengisoli]|uniref:DUF1800 family protein n=1 Tax=Pseudoduganella ginsengisoli TaxID=1462440 RepID=A0A6L6Q5R0_9BURK|nr:DUF1800 domain-containing protein [Pseudoduganella ginsengisoli]MTW04472.1 DUF1800 family protein [Pseudoduganella ginsengisoli]
MQRYALQSWAAACLLSFATAAGAATVTIENTARGEVALGSKVWFVGKVDGKGVFMNFAVNGIPGGNATVGTLNSQNGEYVAPAVMPASRIITVTGTTATTDKLSGSTTLTLKMASTTSPTTSTGSTGSTGTTSPPAPTTPTTPPPLGPQPAIDAATVAAARLLEQATFGPTAADIAQVKNLGAQAWLNQQFAMAPSPMPVTTDMSTLRSNWYKNMAGGQDQLRQRMIFALSQLFVVSADKNPYANEMQPWLTTLNQHAFGNFKNLLREMSLNPSMGKYLDLGNSITPAPNENYAREVMQLFTIGPVMLNQDGSVQLDRNGDAIPTYDQDRITHMSRALSGWTYTGASATGINWENFTGPLQPRDRYHDKSAKTLLMGVTTPAGQTTQQDFDAVMDNLFNHPNLPPFIATRLIRAFTTSNPSPAYITRVADVFANGPSGRGDLQATLNAILMDPEARQPGAGAMPGKLKDPMLHSLSLFRALGAKVNDPNNLFWDYFLLGQRLLSAPSVFNFYSPLTKLPGTPDRFGPEFQVYAPALAIARANFLYQFINGNYNTMVTIDITPYVNVAGDVTKLMNLVDANLLQGRMTPAARAAIAGSVSATTDSKQRALTALYLTAITEFAVQQ